MAKKSTWTLLSWNVNGIRAVAKKGFLEWVASSQPEILCLQETKAHKEQLPHNLTEVPGYQSYWASAQKKGYSGVAVYSKIEPLKVQYGFGKEAFDNEGRTLILEYPSFTLFNIYFPNGKKDQIRLQYKLDYYEEILKYWEKLRKQGKQIIICGDVNTAHKEIDLARPKANEKISGFLPIERKWIDKIIELGYVDIFRKFNQNPEQYTWWDQLTRARERNVGWRIDYFLVSDGIVPRIQSAWIMPEVMGSDHCPIGLKVDVRKG